MTPARSGDTPPVLIVGTGAMACLFGALLSPHVPVTLLGTWEAGLSALREGGIRLHDSGEVRTFRVQAESDPEVCAPARHALVLVKSWQTQDAVGRLKACLAPDGVALTLQNGLGNLEMLQRELGTERAAQGVTAVGATLLAPGEVRVGGRGRTHLLNHPRILPLAETLRRPGLQIEMTDDLDALVWGKLVVNASLNPLTALLRVRNGEILERPAARTLLADAARETAAVAARRGGSLPFEDPVEAVEAVARVTAENRSSMLQDVLRGAPTEIDAINGEVVREAERLGAAAPVNRTLWRLVGGLVAAVPENER